MKNETKNRVGKRLRIRQRIRKKVTGTQERPRLSVFRGNRSMEVQLIDDIAQKTIFSINSRVVKPEDIDKKTPGKIGISKALGKLVATKAKEHNIIKVVFDRGGYRYHGRVKALADGAREAGLEF